MLLQPYKYTNIPRVIHQKHRDQIQSVIIGICVSSFNPQAATIHLESTTKPGGQPCWADSNDLLALNHY